MFRHEKSNLQFPRLVYQKSANFKPRGGKSTRIYVLDWSTLDDLATDRGARLFPEKYLDWLTSMQFAIPHHYRREIRRCVRMAVLERERQLSFDTNIREMCMETAEKFIEVAFDLLADCPYDPEEDYFLRDDRRGILKPAFLYRFWDGQTGRALPWFMSGLDDLKNQQYKYEMEKDRRPYFYDEQCKFIEAVEESSATEGRRLHHPETEENLSEELLASRKATDNIGGRVAARKGVKVKSLNERSVIKQQLENLPSEEPETVQNYLCYHELHVEDRTIKVHSVVAATSQVGALEKLESERGKHYHLQAKGCLGVLTEELATKFLRK